MYKPDIVVTREEDGEHSFVTIFNNADDSFVNIPMNEVLRLADELGDIGADETS